MDDPLPEFTLKTYLELKQNYIRLQQENSQLKQVIEKIQKLLKQKYDELVNVKCNIATSQWELLNEIGSILNGVEKK